MFTKFIGIDTSVAKRWVPRLEDGMLIVDLNEPSQTVASTRRRADESPTEEKTGEQDE